MRYFLFCRHLYNRCLIFNIRIYFSCVPNCLPLYSWNTVISNIFLKLFHRDVHSVYLTCFLIKVVFWAASHELDIRLPPCAKKVTQKKTFTVFTSLNSSVSNQIRWQQLELLDVYPRLCKTSEEFRLCLKCAFEYPLTSFNTNLDRSVKYRTTGIALRVICTYTVLKL